MAEITRERTGELVQGVFRILAEHPDGLRAKRVLEELERRVPPTEFEDTEYEKSPGVRRYENIVRFSTITSVKAGWLVKDRGTWSLTDAGREALRSFSDPRDLLEEARRKYREWVEVQDQSQDQDQAKEQELDEAEADPGSTSFTMSRLACSEPPSVRPSGATPG